MESNINQESGVEESKVGITSFVNDGATVEVSYSAPQSSSQIQIRDQALKDFMAKPVNIYNYLWPTTALANTLLPCYTGAATRLDVATALYATAYWASKLQGFQLVRGTVVFRLVLNASPFQQGRLLMHFLPCCKDFDAVDASYLAMHNASLGGKTQQPCVEVDCRDSSATLRIPYVAPSQWYDVKSAEYDWGTLFISVLSPLLVGAGQAATVDYSLYMSFEDFELAAPLIPQARGKFSSSNRESQAMTEGPITMGLKVSSTVASALTAIPYLAPLMAPVSWVTSQLAGIASAFGWSKPNLEAPIQPMVIQPNRYSAVSGGADSAYPLAMLADNRLSLIDSGTVYDGDEMSFNYLKRKWAFIFQVPWLTDSGYVSGYSLVSSKLGPTLFYDVGTDTKTTYVSTYRQGPPIFYLATNHFGLWRGGIELMFKIVKTDFHIGRLQVTWTPTRSAAETLVTTANSMLSMREIIDIRTGNEFCFKLPYMHNLDYLKTDEHSGFIDIVILNELRAPSTVYQGVQIMCFMRGADDFELEMPINLQYPVYSPQMNQNFSSGNEELVCETIGNYKDVSMSLSHAAECVGECFTSIKQLLNRHNPVYFNSYNGSSTISAQQVYWWPWHRSIAYNSATGLKTPILSQDCYSCMGPMYAFFRGGVRVQFSPVYSSLPVAGSTNIQIVNNLLVKGTSLCLAFLSTGIVDFAFPTALGNAWLTHTKANASAGTLILPASGGMVQTESLLGTFTSSVPYYNRVRMSLGLNQTNSEVIPNEKSQPNSGWFYTNWLATTGGRCSRSFADDFQLMYFIGCPPIVTQSVVP